MYARFQHGQETAYGVVEGDQIRALAGDLFVFRSKRGDCLKLLYWDNDGLAIWYKRLEEGTFVFPRPDPQRPQVGAHGVLIRPAELAMLLDGIELTNVRRRKRYRRPTPAPASTTRKGRGEPRISHISASCRASRRPKIG